MWHVRDAGHEGRDALEHVVRLYMEGKGDIVEVSRVCQLFHFVSTLHCDLRMRDRNGSCRRVRHVATVCTTRQNLATVR